MTTTQKTGSGSSRAHSPKPLDFLNIDAQLSDEEGGALTGIQAFRLKEAARKSRQKMMTKKRPETLPNLLKELASEHGDEEVETFEKPPIVAVNGYALGGWMRACDSLRHPFGVQEREGRPAGGQARDPAH